MVELLTDEECHDRNSRGGMKKPRRQLGRYLGTEGRVNCRGTVARSCTLVQSRSLAGQSILAG
jgi:hypothetical protein